MPDPRYTLSREWPDVRIFVRYMPDRWGLTTWTDDGAIIELAHDLDPERQRYVLAHELGHLVAGKPCRSFCEDNERDVVAWTARYLMPSITKLGNLLRASDVADVARKLRLPPEAVMDRLAHMTPAETEELGTLLERCKTEPGRMAAAERPHRCNRRT